VVVTAAGQSSAPLGYEYLNLVALPVVTRLSPAAGTTLGGTLVTLEGAGFQAFGSVQFLASQGGQLVLVGECTWGDGADATLYSTALIKCERGHCRR
jgi:hypothetical protein